MTASQPPGNSSEAPSTPEPTSEGNPQFNPPPEEQRRIAASHAVFQAMAPFTGPYMTAIARPTSELEGEHIGSGSFMVVAGQVFLVTAHHVADAAQTGFRHQAAFSNGDGKLYQLVTAPFLSDPQLDIAIAPVTLEREPASTRLACPSSKIARAAGPLGDLLFVHGFPGARSRFFQMGPGIVSQTLPYGSTLATPAWPGFNPECHFAIWYDPVFSQFPDGTLAAIPDPGGMSGSAVWDMCRAEAGTHWQPTDARIIGVLHRYDPTARCLIGTRIEYIHGLAARWHSTAANRPAQ